MKFIIVVGILNNVTAKITGITPAVLTFSGIWVLCPPTIFRPTTLLAYWTVIRRSPDSTKMIAAITSAIITAKKTTKKTSAPTKKTKKPASKKPAKKVAKSNKPKKSKRVSKKSKSKVDQPADKPVVLHPQTETKKLPKATATEIKELFKKSKKRGFVTQEDILDVFVEPELYVQQLDDFYEEIINLLSYFFVSITIKKK